LIFSAHHTLRDAQCHPQHLAKTLSEKFNESDTMFNIYFIHTYWAVFDLQVTRCCKDRPEILFFKPKWLDPIHDFSTHKPEDTP
jgi:hypothetical protein